MHEMSDANRPTVLVVDDSESTRYVVSRALKHAGYTVIEAANGEEALELVKSKPDLVTLDIKLPDINGVEVCRRIKMSTELASIPIIHTSATFVQGKDHAHALESGADGYLTHPIEEIVLIATVKAFLRARQAEKERELLLLQSKKDVEQLQVERELRERFVATLSHDLRNPLTAARIGAQLIAKISRVEKQIQMHAERIADNIDRADDMIQDLLDASRVRAGEKLPLEVSQCDLKEIAENAIADLTIIHGKRFVLQTDPHVIGFWDAGALRRVIENLGSNAVKYGASLRPVTVSILQNGDIVTIAVHNEGNPLSIEEQATLFTPYRRSSSAQAGSQKGWGLGLTLTKGLAEAHGGRVTVESDHEKGTTFRVIFPRETIISTLRVSPNIANSHQ